MNDEFFIAVFIAFIIGGIIIYFMEKKDTETENLNYLNKLIESDPKDFIAYMKIGIVETERGNYKKASIAFSKVIKIKPRYAEAYFFRGLSYVLINESEMAFADFNKTIKLNPDYVEAYTERGLIYHDKEEYWEAGLDLTKAKGLGSQKAITFLKYYGVEDND